MCFSKVLLYLGLYIQHLIRVVHKSLQAEVILQLFFFLLTVLEGSGFVSEKLKIVYKL